MAATPALRDDGRMRAVRFEASRAPRIVPLLPRYRFLARPDKYSGLEVDKLRARAFSQVRVLRDGHSSRGVDCVNAMRDGTSVTLVAMEERPFMYVLRSRMNSSGKIS